MPTRSRDRGTGRHNARQKNEKREEDIQIRARERIRDGWGGRRYLHAKGNKKRK